MDDIFRRTQTPVRILDRNAERRKLPRRFLAACRRLADRLVELRHRRAERFGSHVVLFGGEGEAPVGINLQARRLGRLAGSVSSVCSAFGEAGETDCRRRRHCRDAGKGERQALPHALQAVAEGAEALPELGEIGLYSRLADPVESLFAGVAELLELRLDFLAAVERNPLFDRLARHRL
uniref:Uncharacterized protein n=2 Tax=Rhizobium leguminosarum TaxID=384 RepID=A0A1C9I0Y0_RHILT|nr:hypothetical protein [Rhizobium leguminosarum bv. trifolii]